MTAAHAFDGMLGDMHDRVRLGDYPNLRAWVHRLPADHAGRIELDAMLEEANLDAKSTVGLAFGIGATVGLLAGAILCALIAVLS